MNVGTFTSQVLGIGPAGGLQKLSITPEGGSGVDVLFNPAEISRQKTVTWEPPKAVERGWRPTKDSASPHFIAVEAETLTLNLFFDTYESHTGGSIAQQALAALSTMNPFATGSSGDVTRLTDRVAELAEAVPELHRPPICRLSWGVQREIFRGVLSSLDQRFTMFLADGTPVRATLGCTFTEVPSAVSVNSREWQSADLVKIRVVKRGDSLQSLAAEELGDAALWPEIARANDIVNPRVLVPGTTLTIPRLAGG